jgi:type I restriction enzyme, S subunit
MESDWKRTTLGEVCTQVLTGGTPLKSNDDYFKNAIIPWLKTKEVNFCRIYETENHISDIGLRESAAKLVPTNSVIVAMYGQGDTAGRVAINKIPLCTNQACCNLVIDEGKADYQYIYYTLKGSYSELVRRKTGSAQPNLSTKIVKDFEIPLPPLAEQKAIAHILGSLDDKIELNRRMNETLEGMAQALFKSWFVDFDPVLDNALAAGNPIPDELEERAETRRQALADGTANREAAQRFPAIFHLTEELGWIPEGWKVGDLSEICERIFSGGTPNTRTPEYWNGSIPWLSSGETRQRFILKTDKNISQKGVQNSSTRKARKGAVVIASAGQGKTRGQTSRLCFESYINQSVIALEADTNKSSDAYLFFDLSRRYEQFRQMSDSHSSRGSLTTKLLLNMKVVHPPLNIVNDFSNTGAEIVEKIVSNEQLNETLANLRDTLLPKLISGELRIPAAEKLAEEALA